MKIIVDAAALGQLLKALNSWPHEIRELTATREVDAKNPINILEAEYNFAVIEVDKVGLCDNCEWHQPTCPGRVDSSGNCPYYTQPLRTG